MALMVVGQDTQNLIVKPPGMIHFFPVAQFMDHHAVHYFRGRKHQQTVEAKIARATTAAPTAFHAANGDAAITYPHQRGEISDPFRDDPLGLGFQRLNVCRCQRGEGGGLLLPGPGLGQMGFDPLAVVLEKMRYLILADIPGYPEDERSVFDLGGHGFSVTADQFVFHDISYSE